MRPQAMLTPGRSVGRGSVHRRSFMQGAVALGALAASQSLWPLKETQPMTVQAQTLPADEALGALEPVVQFDGPMPTGVTVSHQGRIFVNFPKWGDDVTFTVAEIRNGRPVAYPDEATNRTVDNDPAAALVSVQSVVVDPADRLWILDTGSPLFQPPRYGGPKLVCVDLATDQVVQKILFPPDVALPTSYVNDVRFDLRRGSAGMAFITDSSDKGPNGIIVVDLASGESWRRLHDHPSTKPEGLDTFLPIVEGRPFVQRQPDGTVKPAPAMGSDGIAIAADGARLYYCPLSAVAGCTVWRPMRCSIGPRTAPRRPPCATRATRAARRTGSNPTRRATSTRPTTSITPCCAAVPTAPGSPSPTTRGCSGPTRSRWRPTGIST